MFRKVMFWILAGALAIGTAAAPVLANTGYEGQPGNQSSGGGNQGYEGQPGNQSHN